MREKLTRNLGLKVVAFLIASFIARGNQQHQLVSDLYACA